MSTSSGNASLGLRVVQGCGALVIIAAVTFVGYKTFSHPNQQKGSTISGSASIHTPIQKINTHLTAAVSSGSGPALVVKEMDVSINLDSGIRDAVYAYTASNNPKYPQYVGSIAVSTQSLISADSACSPAKGASPLGVITEFSSNVDGLGNVLVPNGKTVFKIGNDYYVYYPPQSPCSTSPTVHSQSVQYAGAFANDFKSIQASTASAAL